MDDGAVVYLNGVEILRTGLPVAPPISPDTLATIDVRGLAERIFFPFDVSHAVTLLQQGRIAVYLLYSFVTLVVLLGLAL